MNPLHCQLAVLASALLFLSHAGAQGILFYSSSNGTVPGVNVVTGDIDVTVPANAFVGANVGIARETAFDPVTGLLWYSATDGAIYSHNVNTSSAGPSIPAAKITGAIIGASRHLFIDYARRRLMVPTTDGSIQYFDLNTQASVGSLPQTFFTDGNVGAFRHLASDPARRTVWYAATDSSFREFNPDTATHTGRQISTSEQTGAFPGAARHMVVDPQRGLMLYAVTDGSIASINLRTLTAASFNLPSTVFRLGGNTGAGRIITYNLLPVDIGFTGTTTTFNSGTLSLAWNDPGGSYSYTVECNSSLTGLWEPVPPANQWPMQGISGFPIPINNDSKFYRVVVHLPGAYIPPPEE